MLDRVERAREQPVREGVVHEERRHGEQVGVAPVADAVALEGAQVVGVPELPPQLLEELEVLFGGAGAHLAVEIAPEIGDNAVVVEQRVVDVEEEHGARQRHLILPRRRRRLVPAADLGRERRLLRAPNCRPAQRFEDSRDRPSGNAPHRQ
jgi:hypothetical protein